MRCLRMPLDSKSALGGKLRQIIEGEFRTPEWLRFLVFLAVDMAGPVTVMQSTRQRDVSKTSAEFDTFCQHVDRIDIARHREFSSRMRTPRSSFTNGHTVAGRLFLQQPLSNSRFGCEILRSRRVGFDLASERSHIDSQILVLMDRIRAPDFFHKRTTVQRSIHRGPTWSRRPSAEIGIVKTGSRGNASYPAAPPARRTGRQC